MTERLRAGVAGAGVFGGYHANKYAESEAADLTAIFDLDLGRAMDRAASHGAQAFDDYSAFLQEVDVVTIATPATTHAQLAEEAVLAGRHVLVEKPIALNTADADRLIQAARDSDVTLQVGHQERYVASAFGLLDRPVPQSVRSRRMNKYSLRAGDVSVIMDLMIHDLDLLAQLTGQSELEIVDASCRREKSEHADYVDVTVRVGDVQAQLMASRLEETPVRDLSLTYPDGAVELNFLERSITNTTPVEVPTSFDSDDLPSSLKDPLSFGTETFLKAVKAGESPIVTGEAGRAALAMALKIEEAIRD
ncbi:MAG: Gfo/Idh/MocA family oxidoreductase [Parvularculaceae bacterium]|nr:Gfo/Idh/MocA family oxidoreductase [Parvularculaceae bacterium]